MNVSEYDFELPDELIAQEPLPNRHDSRMLAVERTSETYRDQSFIDFPGFLKAGDLLVLNDTKVFPARLIGSLETGAAIELFLVEERPDGLWMTLAKPGKRLGAGKKIFLADDLEAVVEEKHDSGQVIVRFVTDNPLFEVIDRIGRTPLPPYIRREQGVATGDRERYQTVFAAERGAIAAPTAGLHFTPEVLDQIHDRGVIVTQITLHVGYGTFEPIRVDHLAEHRVSPERSVISSEAARELNAAREEGRRVIAVGTTTTRALESSFARHGKFVAESASADLTIRPGYDFKFVDGLLTNFHLPQSSLLVLVSTFAGRQLIMDAYRHAVESKYRFYSYGDCMFIY